jgi:hypothetical protein
LLAALYLGWFVQGLLLQHNVFDYVELPAVMLGLAVVMGFVTANPTPLPRQLFAGFLIVAVLFRSPILIQRLEVWPACWREGSSPELRDRLSVLHKINWQELQRTANYLRSRSAKDGEITCFNMPAAALYRELDIESSTRYHFLQNNWLSFRKQRPRMLDDLAKSGQRFVVVDLTLHGIKVNPERLEDSGGPPLPPSWERWKSRIVFRAERYAVLEIPAAEMPAWMTECFGD